MADEGKRIVSLAEAASVGTSDNFIMDSSNTGTTRAPYSKVAQAISETLGIDALKTIANGAMQKSAYDADGDGVVDNAEKLDFHPASDFALATDLSSLAVAVSGKADSATVNQLATNLADEVSRAESAEQALVSNVSDLQSDVATLKERTATIYGFHINGNESNPDSMVTYLEDAVGMTPAYMNFSTGAFNYGSWQNAFFMPKPCMLKYDRQVDYYLNPNDYTKKADGTASDIADSSYGGNAMMEFPKIWLKIVPDASSDISGSVYIADRQVDSDYNDFAYVDYLGAHKDKFYMPCYNGSVINNVMRSISGVVPSNKYNATQERTYAKANGNGWDIESLSRVQLINFLLILISKSTNSQEKFGRGLSESGTEAINNGFTTGVHNARGLFYGTNSGAASTYTNAVKVFGIENWWGYQWRRYTGDILLNGQQMVKFCPFTEDGSTVQDYNITGDGYIHVANADTKSGSSGGYINQMKFSKYGMFSKVSSGSYTTYFTDGQWYNNSYTAFAFHGGGSYDGRRCGALYVARNGAPSAAYWDAGAAVSCA